MTLNTTLFAALRGASEVVIDGYILEDGGITFLFPDNAEVRVEVGEKCFHVHDQTLYLDDRGFGTFFDTDGTARRGEFLVKSLRPVNVDDLEVV